MKATIQIRSALLLIALVAAVSAVPSTAFATTGGGGSGLPWESSFTTLYTSIQGMAPVFAGIALIIAFAAVMFGEHGGLSRRAVNVIVGGAGLFGVPAVISTLFQGASGTLF